MANSPKSFEELAEETVGTDKVNTLKGQAADAKDDLAQLRADFAKLSETVSSLIAGQASAAKSTVRDAASDLYSRGQDAVQQGVEQAKGAAGELSQTIERNPIASVLAAFGVGMLFGLMSRNR